MSETAFEATTLSGKVREIADYFGQWVGDPSDKEYEDVLREAAERLDLYDRACHLLTLVELAAPTAIPGVAPHGVVTAGTLLKIRSFLDETELLVIPPHSEG